MLGFAEKSHAGTDPREPSKERCSDVLLLRMVKAYHYGKSMTKIDYSKFYEIFDLHT